MRPNERYGASAGMSRHDAARAGRLGEAHPDWDRLQGRIHERNLSPAEVLCTMRQRPRRQRRPSGRPVIEIDALDFLPLFYRAADNLGRANASEYG